MRRPLRRRRAEPGMLGDMTVAVIASLVGLLTVLIALAKDRPLDVVAPGDPAWDTLPSPDDITRVELPLAFPGYDPAHVDAHLEAVRRAYDDVLAVLSPELRERARFRAALRSGAEQAAQPGQALALPPLAPTQVDPDQEALRTVAALAHLEHRG